MTSLSDDDLDKMGRRMLKELRMVTKTYLGDGVYASYDGEFVTLRTETSDNGHQDANIIHLDGSVLRALDDWRKDGFRDYQTGKQFGQRDRVDG